MPQVIRLVRALRHPQVSVLLHFDSKMQEAIDEDGLTKANPNVRVFPTRQSSFLDTWSLTQITLDMMQYAINSNMVSDNGHIMLASGQDYPIKPISAYLEWLHANNRPYMDCNSHREGRWLSYKTCFSAANYRIFEHMVMHGYNLAERIICKVWRLCELHFMPKSHTIISRLRALGVEPYGGSTWWTMPTQMAKEILNETSTNRELTDVMKHIVTPDEMFFPTMAMHSSFADKMQVDAPKDGEVWQNCQTFANFRSPLGEYTGHPYPLTMSDLPRLKAVKQFFARKFDQNYDSEILDYIDANILGIK